MTDFDIAMLVLVAVTAVWGGYCGLVRQATSLGAWSVGVLAAAMFRQPVAEWIGGSAPANEIGAAIILLFSSSLAVHLCGASLRAWLEDVQLEGFDRQMGLALGAVKGVAVAILVTVAMYHFRESSRDTIARSMTARHVANIAERVEPLVPPPADKWVATHIKEPFEGIRDKEHNIVPRRLVIASRSTSAAR